MMKIRLKYGRNISVWCTAKYGAYLTAYGRKDTVFNHPGNDEILRIRLYFARLYLIRNALVKMSYYGLPDSFVTVFFSSFLFLAKTNRWLGKNAT